MRDSWDSTGYAPWEAGAALVTRGNITEAECELLVAPWASVMGRTWEEKGS